MVEPPMTLGRVLRVALASTRTVTASARVCAFWLRSQAFSSASQSTPLCSAKPESSEAITARLRLSEIRGASTQRWLQLNEPRSLSSRQISER